MTTGEIAVLLSAFGFGGVLQAFVNSWMNRRVTDADATVKIVTASGDFTEAVLKRLAVVEAKVSLLEAENDLLRDQLFRLGHTPLIIPPNKESGNE